MAKIPRRMVVFLGAGASAPFGYPLTTSLLPRIWEGLHTAAGPNSWVRWAGMKHRRGDAGRLKNLIEALLPGVAGGAKLDDGVSIVDVISIIDQMLVEGRSPHSMMSVRELLAARQVLNKAINGVLQGRRKLGYAERLADWILGASTEHEDSRVSVVSTNYDTAIEGPLFRHFVRHGVSVGRVVDLGMPWRDASRPRLHVRPTEARLAFLKLHGSLNWLRCETCGYVTVNVMQRIASLDHWERRSPLGFNVCWCNGLLRSILVTPSVVRDVRDANLLGIWGAALEDLRLADEWVMVGYSLPPEDIAIRSLLLRAQHARRKRLRVRVVQLENPARTPRSETHARYRMFFPPAALEESHYLRDGVEPFVDSLAVPPPAELDTRLRKMFGGRSSNELRRRDRERKLREAELKLARRRR